MYYDVKKNQMSDQGVITRYDQTTGRMECDAYHLTDFAIVEFETNGLKATTMDANLDKKDVFKPLNMAGTTPVVVMIIISIALGILIPFAIVLDNISADAVKKEAFMDPSMKEKTLTDVMFFNKYEERTKP